MKIEMSESKSSFCLHLQMPDFRVIILMGEGVKAKKRALYSVYAREGKRLRGVKSTIRGAWA